MSGRRPDARIGAESERRLQGQENAITDRDADINALRQRVERFEGLSAVEFYNCALYVGEAKDSIVAADRGRELARMIRRLWDLGADL